MIIFPVPNVVQNNLQTKLLKFVYLNLTIFFSTSDVYLIVICLFNNSDEYPCQESD